MSNPIITASKFEEGNIYLMSFIGDSSLKVQFICLKRSPKMATFQRYQSKDEPIKRKINLNGAIEYVSEGSYSMSPTIYSNKIVG